MEIAYELIFKVITCYLALPIPYCLGSKRGFWFKSHDIIDRFHVAKNYRGAIETLCKKETRRLKKELSEDEYKKLKNSIWILRKKETSYSDGEKETLNLFFKYSPVMKTAYKFRNKLTNIFDQFISPKQANC